MCRTLRTWLRDDVVCGDDETRRRNPNTETLLAMQRESERTDTKRLAEGISGSGCVKIWN